MVENNKSVASTQTTPATPKAIISKPAPSTPSATIPKATPPQPAPVANLQKPVAPIKTPSIAMPPVENNPTATNPIEQPKEERKIKLWMWIALAFSIIAIIGIVTYFIFFF